MNLLERPLEYHASGDSPDKPPPVPNPDPDAPPIPTPPGEEPKEPIYAPPDNPIDTGIEKPKIIV